LRLDRDGNILDVKGDTRHWRTPAAQVIGSNVRRLLEPQIAEGVIEAIGRSIATGEKQTYEFAAPDARGPQYFEARIVSCGAAEVVTSVRDVTERKRAEEEARHRLAELAHVGRLSSMGAMAAALAHELNQPLMAIVGYASGCVHRIEAGGSDQRELLVALRQVSEQAARAGEIIRRLRDFIRKGPPRRQPVDVNRLIREAVGIAELDARDRGIALQLDLYPRLPPVMGDGIQIEQVILNLLRNGLEAMTDCSVNGNALLVQSRYGENSAVEVSVCDRGAGLPLGLEEQLYDPFISTKANGLGIGLSISRSIVEAHGGRLWAMSNEDRGMTFRFTLPVARVLE